MSLFFKNSISFFSFFKEKNETFKEMRIIIILNIFNGTVYLNDGVLEHF